MVEIINIAFSHGIEASIARVILIISTVYVYIVTDRPWV
jgi:hypothetical protein